MYRKMISVGLISLMAVSPVFAAKAKRSTRHRAVGVSTLAKRQSHLAVEIATKANAESQQAAKKSNKKLKMQAALLHQAASAAHAASQDLMQATKYSRR